MIARLNGELLEVRDDHLLVSAGAVCYAVHMPAGDRGAWLDQVGSTVTIETLHYLEAHGQGSSMLPRLIGFRHEVDRRFFEVFTTVKGIGARKALRMLQLPCATVAQAIAMKDVALLVSLPEVGKRTAETIVAELHGKVEEFIDAASQGSARAIETKPALMPIGQDAITVLVQLGESPASAEQRVRDALHADASLDSADAIIAAVYGS
ncbi:MAG: Holliday junction branch migration protein RuvA [Planctomycetota bacterium]